MRWVTGRERAGEGRFVPVSPHGLRCLNEEADDILATHRHLMGQQRQQTTERQGVRGNWHKSTLSLLVFHLIRWEPANRAFSKGRSLIKNLRRKRLKSRLLLTPLSIWMVIPRLSVKLCIGIKQILSTCVDPALPTGITQRFQSLIGTRATNMPHRLVDTAKKLSILERFQKS